MKRIRPSPLYLVAVSVLLSIRDAAGFVDSSRVARATRLRLSSTSTAESEAQQEPTSSSGCPFSMAFPRYRIDLSSEKAAKKRFDAVKSGLGIFSGIKQVADKSTVERRYSEEAKDGQLFFVDCSVDADTLQRAKGEYDRTKGSTNEKGDVSDDEWQMGIGGMRAASQFWKIFADMADEGISPVQPHQRSVISFIGATPVQIQRLIDIASWLEDDMVGDHSHLRIDADDEMPIPTVVIEQRTTRANDVVRLGERNSDDLPPADVIEERIKAWVRRILVNLSICPFTKSDTRSGQGLAEFSIPTGCISYHYSKTGPSNIPRLMADCWGAILEMVEAGPGGKSGVSSILLSAPLFDDDFSLWSGPIFSMLEAGVGAAGAEPIIGVVCFHPRYATPDGTSWPGFGHMHSVPRLRKWMDEQDPELAEKLTDDQIAAGGAWQRRTPHAVLNVLRANQLEAAESRRQSPQMYSRNIRVLVAGEEDGGIGSDKLLEELEKERSLSSQ